MGQLSQQVSAALGITPLPEVTLTIPELAPPAASFRRNILRVIYSIDLLPDLIELAGNRMRFELECLQGTGTDRFGFERTEPVHPRDVEDEVWNKMYSVSRYDLRPLGAWPEYYRTPPALLDHLWHHLGDTRQGFEAVLMSAAVLTWTAFETLAGDLWVAALNSRPKGLASLTGSSKRIGKLGGITRSTSDDESVTGVVGEKSISLAEIERLTMGRYDLRGRMGDLLRQRFKFTTLRGIREAYSVAFSEKEKAARTDSLDASLADPSLDVLCAVRNLIVHKAGVADPEYEEAAKLLPKLPGVRVGEMMELNGEQMRAMVDPVIVCGTKLIKAIDAWLVLVNVP